MGLSQQPGTICAFVNGTTGAFFVNFGFVSSARIGQGSYSVNTPADWNVKTDVFPTVTIHNAGGREAVGLLAGAPGSGLWSVVIWADAGGGATVDRDFWFKVERMLT